MLTPVGFRKHPRIRWCSSCQSFMVSHLWSRVLYPKLCDWLNNVNICCIQETHLQEDKSF
jgi:hypothetical protein